MKINRPAKLAVGWGLIGAFINLCFFLSLEIKNLNQFIGMVMMLGGFFSLPTYPILGFFKYITFLLLETYKKTTFFSNVIFSTAYIFDVFISAFFAWFVLGYVAEAFFIPRFNKKLYGYLSFSGIYIFIFIISILLS